MNRQAVIDQARPLIEEFLSDVGIYEAGQPRFDGRLLDSFSGWLDAQDITADDVSFLAARVGAFICEYCREGCGGVCFVDGTQILLSLPIEPGVSRVFDPYRAAIGIVQRQHSLKEFLQVLCN